MSKGVLKLHLNLPELFYKYIIHLKINSLNLKQLTIFQDFTGVPAVVDFAAMRDAVKSLGGDPNKINPVCPSDLVIDHSIQADFVRE